MVPILFVYIDTNWLANRSSCILRHGYIHEHNLQPKFSCWCWEPNEAGFRYLVMENIPKHHSTSDKDFSGDEILNWLANLTNLFS